MHWTEELVDAIEGLDGMWCFLYASDIERTAFTLATRLSARRQIRGCPILTEVTVSPIPAVVTREADHLLPNCRGRTLIPPFPTISRPTWERGS